MILKTCNQNYYYDNDIGLIIPNAKIIFAILNINNWQNVKKEKIIDCLKNEFATQQISFIYDWLVKYKKFKESNVTEEYIPCDNIKMLKDYLIKIGFKQLILSITDDCNFRCSYCTYSSEYDNFRSHSSNYMTFDTAKKAIDIYLDYIIKGQKYNLFKQPIFGFYGGEPLLNYKLIKKSVQYIKNIYDDEVFFNISTNGSLLNKTTMDFLMENRFSINISFDGNQYEQNRKRKFKDGKNSFNIVLNNIKYLIECDYDLFHVHPVFDLKTDFKECESFFKEKNIKVISISDVDTKFTKKYYDKFSYEDYNSFNKNLLTLTDNYTPNSFYSYSYHLFESPCADFFFGSKMFNKIHVFNKYSDSCIPGEKLFVNSKGIFHMCERVPETKHIGNVEEGINFDNILNIINEYNEQLNNCHTCDISFICNKCFRDFMEEKDFSSTKKVCCSSIEDTKITLEKYLKFMEKHQNSIEKRNIYYNHLFNWRQ